MLWIKTDLKVFVCLLGDQDFCSGKNSKQERLIIKASGLTDQRLLFCSSLGWNARFLISVVHFAVHDLLFAFLVFQLVFIYCRILESHAAQALQELFGSLAQHLLVLPLCSFNVSWELPKKILGSRISLSTVELLLSLEYFKFFLYYRHYSLKPSQK